MKNKNILYFTKTMGVGGTEKVIIQLCKEFNKEFNKIIVCSSGGVHESVLQDLNIKHYSIPDLENKDIKSILKTLKILFNVIKKEQINIIHTHHRMAAFYTRILSFFKRFLFIHTAHNTFEDKKIFTKFALNKSNIIAVGDEVNKNLVSYYKIKNERVKTIYNGVDDKFKKENIEELLRWKEEGYFLVGNIGRLSKQKGVKYFINAIPGIISNCKKIKFVIVGIGELENELKRMCERLDIREHVIFMGYKENVQNIISNLDLVVLPSLWEGLPLIPIECFSVKKTIVATDVAGTCEIVKNRENGIIVSRESYKEIEEAVVELYKDSNLKEMLEEKAYDTYINNFSIDKFNNEYKKYYLKIINNE